jgi:hypothetical protein
MNIKFGSQHGRGAPETKRTEIDEVISVIDMLRSIIEEENQFLRSGLPRSLFAWGDVKQDLADRFAALAPSISDIIDSGEGSSSAALRALMERLPVLRAVTDENMRLLEAAIAATRRRIEAAIAAARVELDSTSPYDAKGASMIARLVSNTSRLSA